MAYAPYTWVNGVSAAGATNLNHLEAGVEDADNRLTALEALGGGGGGYYTTVVADTTGVVSAHTTIATAIGGGGAVYMPPGTYRYTATTFVSLPANLYLFAEPGTVTINFDGSATELFRITGANVTIDGIIITRGANINGICFG